MSNQPIILKYHSDDFISNSTFKKHLEDISANNPVEILQKIATIDNKTVLITNVQSDLNLSPKGVTYGRPEEGYEGPLIHLSFAKPVTEVSTSHITEKGGYLIQGNSEDAIYFFNDGKLTINNRTYHVEDDTFIFLNNTNQYSLHLSENGNGILISRFGKSEKIDNIKNHREYLLDREAKTCQWALMHFRANSTLAAHSHKLKEEFFYFLDDIDIATDIKAGTPPDFVRKNGFIDIDRTVIHSMKSTHGDITFLSLNLPSIINDSDRISG